MAAVYEKLRERLDKFPQGFPATKKGTELKILEGLFTPGEAEIALHVRPVPEEVGDIAARMGREEKQLSKDLYSMSRKGQLLRKKGPGGEILYALAPWIIGLYEHQLKSMTAADLELYTQYNLEGLIPYIASSRVPMIRVLPVEAEIIDTRGVQPYDRVSEFLEKSARFAVAECICRKGQKMIGQGCGKTIEACLVAGSGADYYIENGWAREITREEAKDVLRKAEEEGLVHNCSNDTSENVFICNCCGCCCGMMRVINFGVNTKFIASPYRAVKDQEVCTVCLTCVDRCQVHAIKQVDGRTVINRDLCIGCGLCTSTCPSGSIRLERKPAAELPPIYNTEEQRLQASGRDKAKAYPFD